MTSSQIATLHIDTPTDVRYLFHMTGPGQPDLLALRRSRIDILMRLGEVARERLAGVTHRLESEPHTDRLLTTLSISFERISRWIRLIITLCFHIERGAWDDPRPPRPPRPRRGAEALAESRETAAEPRLERDPEDDERPEREETFDSYLARPFGEVVALICRGLDITPDWAAWSAEPWAQEERRTRPLTSPYAGWPDPAPDDMGRPAFRPSWSDPAPSPAEVRSRPPDVHRPSPNPPSSPGVSPGDP
jgi:hypothetical protein